MSLIRVRSKRPELENQLTEILQKNNFSSLTVGPVEIWDSKDPEIQYRKKEPGIHYGIIISKAQADAQDPQVLYSLGYSFALTDPLTTLELWTALKAISHEQGLKEVAVDLKGATEQMEIDLEWLRSLHRARFENPLPKLKGVQLTGKYLAGVRSGGDFFDVVHDSTETRLSILVTDSSTYGLSSLIHGAAAKAMHSAVRDQSWSPDRLVRSLFQEIGGSMQSRDQLSMVSMTVDLKRYIAELCILGSCEVFRLHKDGQMERQPKNGDALHRAKPPLATLSPQKLSLEGGEKLILLSDGMVEAAGGVEAFSGILEGLRGVPVLQWLEVLSFEVKKKLTGQDDLPVQDSTVILVEVDQRILKLT